MAFMQATGGSRTTARRQTTSASQTQTKAANDQTAYQYDNLGDGWNLFINICRWFPDFLFDLCRAEDADYELTLIQRIIMRTKARYQYCDITG